MREDRLDNAVAALDILARADSTAFAHGRNDMSYRTTQLTDLVAEMRAKIANTSNAQYKAELQKALDTAQRELDATSRSDAAPGGGVACTFILVDGSVDQVIQHTGAWQSIVAREVRDLKAMDCGRVTTKEYANESVGYAKHDSVRQDATEGRYAIHYRDIRSNREMTATVTGSSMDDAESKFCRQSNVLPQYVYDVKRV